jgi:integral membrane sensor domain MASE1
MRQRSLALDGALRLTLVGFAYFAVAYLGLQLASINPSATPIWPATGLAIAAMLLWDYRVAPAIFIAAFMVNYMTAGSPLTSLAIAFGNSLEAATTAWLVKNWADGERVFDSSAGVGKFALISAATTTSSATIGVGSLVLAGFAEADNAAPIWLTWWLGDFAGAVVVTPAALLWMRADERSIPHEALQSGLTYAAAAAVGVIAFSPLTFQTPLRDPLGFSLSRLCYGRRFGGVHATRRPSRPFWRLRRVGYNDAKRAFRASDA